MQTETHTTVQKGAQRPAEFELGDGSWLVPDEAATSAGQRIEGQDERISLADLTSMSVEPFAGYRLRRD